MRVVIHVLAPVLSGALALLGCADASDGVLGAPCEKDEDCKDELTCDFHGESGSCQTPHDH